MVLQTGDCCTRGAEFWVYNKCSIPPSQNEDEGAMSEPKTALGYIRVSTDQQGERGYGLDAQTEKIREEATRRGWDLQHIYVDVASGRTTKRRPQYAQAVRALSSGKADVLVVAKLDRLSRSSLDFAGLMAQASRDGWSIDALDVGIDTSTINGELIATLLIALAQWERRLIGERTELALRQVKLRGTKLGRPTVVVPEALAIIHAMRGSGSSYRQIADALNRQKVPTAQGGREWYASTVRAIEKRTA